MAEIAHRATEHESQSVSGGRRGDAAAGPGSSNAPEAPALSQPPQPDRRRAKALLQNYYGLEGTAGVSAVSGGDGAKPAQRVVDPLDVDSPSFDVEKYFQKLLQEKALSGLLQKDTDLISEIRQLDGDMKTLVYENYSKFISATDTIRRMKSNVENMETEMAKLTNNIELITKSSSALNETFGEKRHKIRQLSGVHNLLKKLQFIFELPNRLTECLKVGMYGQAVRYYARATKLLAHYRHLSVFCNIEDECRHIVGSVGNEVKARMRREDATPSEVSEFAGLLLGLGEDPVDQIWKEYIKVALHQFGELRKKVVSKISQLALIPLAQRMQVEEQAASAAAEGKSPSSTKSPSSAGPSSEEDAVNYLNTIFLAEVAKFLASFRAYFLSEQVPASAAPFTTGTAPGSAAKSANLSPGFGVPGGRQQPVVDRAFIVILSPEQRRVAQSDLYEAIEGLMKDYFDVLERFLQLPTDPMGIGMNVALPAYVFNKVQNDMAAYEVLTSMARLQDRLRRCARAWVQQLMRAVFEHVRSQLLERLPVFDKSENSSSMKHADVFGSLHETEGWLQAELSQRCLPFLESFTQPQYSVMQWPNGIEEYLSYVQTGLRDFWDMALQSMMDHVNPPRVALSPSDEAFQRPPPVTTCRKSPMASLVLACIARRCAQNVAPAVYEAFSDRLFGTGRRRVKEHVVGMGQYAVYGGGPAGGLDVEQRSKQRREDEMGGLFPEGREVAGACREKAQRLLNFYVERLGQDLSVEVRHNIESRNWLAAREPRGVSRIWEQVLSALTEIENDAINACGDEETISRGGGDQSSEGSRRPASHLGGNTSPHGSMRRHQQSPSFSGSTHRISQLGTGPGRPSITGSMISYDRNLLSRIDRLFSERLEIFGTVPFSASGVLTGVIKIVIKAMTEITRLQTLSRNGFQQVQVDVEFLRVQLSRFLNDDRLLNSMLEDALTSAHRRCADPVQLDVNVIDRVIVTFSDD